MNVLINALTFLIDLGFDLYIIILLMRLLMQKLGVRYNNPVFLFTVRATQFLVRPLSRVFFSYKGFDLAIVFLMLILEIFEMILIMLLKYKIFPGFLGTLIACIGALGIKVLNLYFYAVILSAIMSWVPTLRSNPLAELVYALSEPLLRQLRRLIPLVGGFDLSPLPALIGLQFITILILNPIVSYGTQLAML